MRKISSSMTFVNKRVFPCVWFGVIAIFICMAVPHVIFQGGPWMALIVPIALAVFGYVLMRQLVFDLVDEVFLSENQLTIRNLGQEERVPMENVINVDASMMTNPERITLTLREPCQFGKEIAFSPPSRLFPFGRHPLSKELIELADAARTKSDARAFASRSF